MQQRQHGAYECLVNMVTDVNVLEVESGGAFNGGAVPSGPVQSVRSSLLSLVRLVEVAGRSPGQGPQSAPTAKPEDIQRFL